MRDGALAHLQVQPYIKQNGSGRDLRKELLF